MKIVYFSYRENLGIDHEVLHIDGREVHDDNRDDVIQKIKNFKPDLLLEEEKSDGISDFRKIYQEFPDVKKAWWMIDAHCNLIDHVAYAKQFDYVFCAQSWFIPLFQNEVKAKLYWLPLCHSQSLPDYLDWLDKPQPKRDIELSFVGNIRSIHVDREKYIKQFMKEMGKKFFAANQSYDLTLNTLSRSKMTFNCSLNNDLNFRVWEALATDTPLMTDFVTDIPKVANLARHIVSIYLKETDKRQIKVSQEPYVSSIEFIKSGHTLTHRINQALWMIESGSQYEF